MTETNDRTESFFAAAVALPSDGERAAYLDRACAGDAALRGHVEALLGAHERSGHLLDRPVPGVPEQTGAYAPDKQTRTYVAREQPGTVIAGRYKLLEQIGEGGMGTVWVAEQTQPVKRKVALKLIKAGMDSKSVLARFEAERQALAVMDHPNIAKILDGGLTETGRPYFVMEYVKGVPITEYCDVMRMGVPERLNLFVQVCSAVEHAHQKGIIHRDLKPSNILVAPYDGKPVPKVIDFGLTKAIHQSLTDRTLHTAYETVLGTPLYMSPEQAQLNNLDVDTRSDIYSLGVLLYELLTGTTPLEKQRLKEAAWDEMKRLIREEEAPKPSTRLSSNNTLASLAAGRQIEPARLTKLVRGELDWIVMKSLEKDRTRRYETANGFALDIQRFLAGDPVQAAPPSARYRLRKLAQKHRAVLTTTAVIVLLLLVGAAVGTWQAVRATAAEREAKEAQGLAYLDRDRAQKAEAQAKADRDKAEDESKHFQQNELYYNGMLQTERGDYNSAEKLFVESLRVARSRRGLRDVETQMIVWAQAGVYVQMKTPEKGEALLRELLDFQKEHGQADSLPLPYATTLEFLGHNLLQQSKWEAAEAMLRECLTIRENKEPPLMFGRFSTKSLLGASLVGQKKYADAEPYLLQGYQGLKERADWAAPGVGRIPVREAAERLVQFYEAIGKQDKADDWRKRLKETRNTGKSALAL